MTETTPLLAAVARRTITPPAGIYLIGYADRTRGNAGVHDELTATALVLDDGATRLAIVALDMLVINEFIVDRVRAQLPYIQMLLCCSHTHSGPIAYADEKSNAASRQYVDSLVENITAAVKEAARKLAPARLEMALGEADLAVNRRERQPDGKMKIGKNPAGVVDQSVQVVSVFTYPLPPSVELPLPPVPQDEKRIATLVNYACHGTLLGPENLLVSADWIGALRAKVEQELGGLALFVQGATANLNPDTDWPADFQKMTEAGQRVADSVLAAIQRGGETIRSTPLRVERSETWLPLDASVMSDTPPTTAYRVPLLKMAGLPGWLGFAVDYLLSVRYPWKARIEPRAGFWHVPMRVSAVQLGDLGLVAFGAEVFTEIGLAVKAASSAKYTLFASLTDGSVSYLATAAAHEEGGYEVDTAPYPYRYPGRLKAECESLALETAQRLLDRLW
jgi:hypothetical protein